MADETTKKWVIGGLGLTGAVVAALITGGYSKEALKTGAQIGETVGKMLTDS